MDFIKTPPNRDSTDRILYSIEGSILSTIFSDYPNQILESSFIMMKILQDSHNKERERGL